jgi:ABC-type tungstate transport system permease subunit
MKCADNSGGNNMKNLFAKILLYLMYNYFVIIGPENDPAGIKKASNATNAFSRIASKQSPFISRGENSGTHIWNYRSQLLTSRMVIHSRTEEHILQ